MRKYKNVYLIQIQYLGFRYSGWQIQPGQRTVEGMLFKTLKFILQGKKFKILGAGRTDAKVSALNTAFELFLENPVANYNVLLSNFNYNLPPDIRATQISAVSREFNVIKDAKAKEYVYLFSFGEKNHPYCAPYLANILSDLNIEVMTNAAKLFEGTYDFSNYTVKDKGNSHAIRTIKDCTLKKNEVLTTSFFPQVTYALHVSGTGFLRYQIRMIMGALIQLGKNEISTVDIEASLNDERGARFNYIAPGSGLHLKNVLFDASSE